MLHNLNSWSLSQLQISFICTEVSYHIRLYQTIPFVSVNLVVCVWNYINLHTCAFGSSVVGQRFEFCIEFILCAFPLLKDSMHLFSFDFMLRSLYDLVVGLSEARNCLSHLEHQRWLEIHHSILRVLIGSSFRDHLLTLVLRWRSVVSIDKLVSQFLLKVDVVLLTVQHGGI